MSTLSRQRGESPSPLRNETIGETLRRTAERFGAREALVVRHQGFRATYADLWRLTTAVARGLLAKGVAAGDRVGIWAPNRFEWLVTQLATARVGAILVNVNPAYKTAELEYVLRQSGARLLLLSRGFRQSDFAAMAREARSRCPALEELVVFEDDWERLLAAGESVPEAALAERERALSPVDAINIQYTSGTTGFPKGATLTHHNILNNAAFVGERLRYGERDRICLPVPFYHCFGMVLGNLAAIVRGACVVVPAESFDPAATLTAVAEERCTSLYGVPTMFIAVLEHPDFDRHDLTSLRTGIMAGAPCPREVMRQVMTRLHMPEVTIGYGMTETSPISTQTRPQDPEELRVGTVGTVHPHVEVKIVDPASGETVPRGAVGELCTRGYSVMAGYWNDEKATRAAIDAEGWMHSGDLASMDAEGYVRIEGRLKDMIIRGGENIYPREIEEFLHTHAAVAEAHVVGVPDDHYGEVAMAWIKARAGARVSEEELLAFCRGRIATYKIPRYWRFVDSFPLTVTGKVQKFRLRELAASQS